MYPVIAHLCEFYSQCKLNISDTFNNRFIRLHVQPLWWRGLSVFWSFIVWRLHKVSVLWFRLAWHVASHLNKRKPHSINIWSSPHGYYVSRALGQDDTTLCAPFSLRLSMNPNLLQSGLSFCCLFLLSKLLSANDVDSFIAKTKQKTQPFAYTFGSLDCPLLDLI